MADSSKKEEEAWNIIAVDGDMETQLQWIRTNVVLGQSKVQIRWSIPSKTPAGTYRIRHIGQYKVIPHKIILHNVKSNSNNFSHSYYHKYLFLLHFFLEIFLALVVRINFI